MIVKTILEHVKNQFESDTTGHDWFHIERVYKMACHLHTKEGGDLEIIQLAALLHDISDHKMNGGKLNDGGNVALQLLIQNGYNEDKAMIVANIVDGVSFKGALVKDQQISIEGLAQKIIEITGSKSKIVKVPYSQAYPEGFEDMQRRVPDISKIKNVLGWSPQKGLDQVIKDIVAFYSI
jgi:hypothetical protein